MCYKTSHHQSGFTLLEVIIAMSIFAIISIMAYSGLHSVINSKEHTEKALERLQALQLTMLTLTGDFQQLSSRTGHDALRGKLLNLTTLDSDYITAFTRSGWRNPAKQARSTLQRVAYKMDEDKLIRIYWTHVDRANDDQFVERVLIDNIESIDIRYLDDKNRWQSDWPSAESLASGPANGQATGTTATTLSNIPIAVEITLKMYDWGEIKRMVKVAR